MANQSYRDVGGCTIHGTSISGVESIRLRDQADEIEYVADDNQYRQDVGVTRQFIGLDVERKASTKLRDIISAVFTSDQGAVTGSVTIGRVQSCEISQDGSTIRDSGDADTWIRYIGVTGIGGEARCEFRDLAQQRTGVLVKGKKGTLTVSVPVPRTGFGLPAGTATEEYALSCEVIEMEDEVSHGDLANANIRFALYGSTDPVGQNAAADSGLGLVAVGDDDTVSYTAPAADAGSAEAVAVTNAVCVGRTLSFRHGDHARATYRFEAYSSDGTTAPVS